MIITHEGYYALHETAKGVRLTEVDNYYQQEVFKRPPEKYGDTLLVSNYGRVFLLKSHKFATISNTKLHKYYYFTHTYPTGKRTLVRLHKILIETFKPKPNNNFDWACSFRDGDHSNINLTNLYWVKRHKYEQLKKKRKHVNTLSIEIINKSTGEIQTTQTIKHAAEVTNKHYKRLVKHFQQSMTIDIDEYQLTRNVI